MKATKSYILGVGGFAFMEKPQTMKAIIYFLLSKLSLLPSNSYKKYNGLHVYSSFIAQETFFYASQ